jgi:hemoglobin/transferrin/lactoferrin receptor protein
MTIRDAVTLSPLEGAAITCVPCGAFAVTGAQGRADLSAFGDGMVAIITHLGYKTDSLRVVPGEEHVLYMQRQAIGLPEFVVSASRFLENRRDVPEQIEILDRRAIALLDQQTTPDLLQNSGLAYVQRSQMGGGSPVIRGFEASRVLLVVDGVRMNNAIYRAGHLQDLMTVDQNAIERIEVISGPGSVVYGSDALGGVIHLITRQPRFRDAQGMGVNGGALLRTSTANQERTASATIELRGRKLASLTSITASDFGDLRMGTVRDPRYAGWGIKPFVVETVDGQDSALVNPDPDVQSPTAYKQLDVLQKLRLRTGERTTHQLNAQWSTSTDVPRYDRLSEHDTDSLGNFIPAQAEWYYGPQKRMLLAYALETERSAGFFDKARITPSYQLIEQSRHSRSFGSSRLGHRNEQVQVVGLSADFEKRIGKHELRYGAEYCGNTVSSEAHREDIHTGSVSYLSTRYPNGGSTMNTLAAFVSHTLELSDRFIITEGLRFSRVDLESTFDDDVDFQFLNGTHAQHNAALNWRLGIVYMPGHDWRFTVLASTGFRAPNVDDMGKVFDSTSGTVIVPNTDLKPERTTNIELGASKTITDRLTVEANGFYTWYADALTVGNYLYNTGSGAGAGSQDSIDYDGTLSRVTALTNQREAYLYGAQGQFTLAFAQRFTFRSAITYTYGRVRTDSTPARGPGLARPLDHIPPVYGSCGLHWAANRVHAEAYVLFNGWKRLEDTDTTPGSEDNLQYATVDGTPAWYTLNVRGSYAINDNLSVQAGLENIADQHYRTFASGISAPGRNLLVSLRAQW